MKKETLNQLKDFEIFVERMEAFVENAMRGERSEKYNRNDFDLRTYDGDIFPLPKSLEDYMEMWKAVQEDFNKVKEMWDDADFSRNEFFFDLYWNDVDGNQAFYDDAVFWLYYDYEKGVVYDIPTDEQTLSNNREWVKYNEEVFSQLWIER